jgi:hypothetical protein
MAINRRMDGTGDREGRHVAQSNGGAEYDSFSSILAELEGLVAELNSPGGERAEVRARIDHCLARARLSPYYGAAVDDLVEAMVDLRQRSDG